MRKGVKFFLLLIICSTIGGRMAFAQAKPSAKTQPDQKIRNAVEIDDMVALKQFLDSGGDPNGKVEGATLVSVATLSAGTPHKECLRMLLQRGANPNMPDDDGIFPLYRAGDTYHLGEDTFRFLLQNGADVNQKTRKGNTALMRLCTYASRRDLPKNLNLINEALAKGAAVNARNHDGLSALDIANDLGNVQIVALLRKKGASVAGPKTSVDQQMKAFKIAVRKKSAPDVLRFLAKTQISVVYPNRVAGKAWENTNTYNVNEGRTDFLKRKGGLYGELFQPAEAGEDPETTFRDCLMATPEKTWEKKADHVFRGQVNLLDPNTKASNDIYVKWKVQAGQWVIYEIGYPRHQL